MKNVKFEDGRVIVDPPKKPKKITGTRFGAVLSANKWQTPFQAWCEMTKAYCKPFEDTIYTSAGKVIEDKQLTWFGRLLPVVRPEDVYGKDFFDKTFGDFFSKVDVFGGMWDSLVGTKDAPTGVIECKTTKRSEDWKDDIPEYYALQASLYARLLLVDDVYMIVTFLDDGDYEHPEDFKCNADNTTYIHFKVSERYPDFEDYLCYCERFWKDNVLAGVSPEYDEKADKEYLDALRTNLITDDTNIEELVSEAEKLYNIISEVNASISEETARLKQIEEMLKKYAIENISDSENKAIFKGSSVKWTVTKSQKKSVDTKKLQKDGLYDKYLKIEDSYTIRKSKEEGDVEV